MGNLGLYGFSAINLESEETETYRTLVTAIPDLLLWLDATQLGMVQDEAVTNWPDLSGNNIHFVAPAASAPHYEASAINGLPGVRFDANAERLQCNGLIPLTNYTLFVVYRHHTKVAQYPVIFAQNDHGSGITIHIVGTQVLFRYIATDLYAANGSASADTDYYYTFWHGSEMRVYINNGAYANGAGTPSALVKRFSLCNSSTLSSNYTRCSIGEVIMYRRALETGEISQLHSYIAAKWGI